MSAPAGGDKKNIVKMAYIYFQEGRWDKAIEEYKKLIVLDPEDINTHNMLGDVYVKKGASRDAFDEYIKVSADFSSRGQSDKAAIVNKKIAALDTNALPAESQKKQSLIKQTLKAETAMEQGNVDEAIEALSEVAKLDSENLAAFAKLGELFEKKGQLHEAVQQYNMLGGVFIKNRLFKKAQEMFQRVVQLEPNNIDARINLAQIHIKQGSESDAKKEFLTIAELALNTGDMEKANTYAMKAVEFKSIEAHYILGMVFFKKQQLSEAKAEFESLLRFKVNHVGALTYLGKVYLETNQTDKASENIQKALKLEKDNLPAMEAWVELCVKKGNKAEAATTLTALVDRHLAKNDLTKAAEFVRYMISIDENSIPALTKLADILKQNGDKHGAADSYFKVALQYEKQAKKDPMMEFVKKTLELNPGHTEAQKRMMGGIVAGGVSAAAAAAPAVVAPAPASKAVEAVGKIAPTGVLDLEEIAKPPQEVPKAAAPPPVAAPVPAAAQPPKVEPAPSDPQEELRAEMAIAEDYVKQGLVQEAIEIYQQLLETHPNHPEVKEKLNQAYTAYVKTGDDVIGALEAEKKAKEDEEKILRQEMEKKAQEEAKRLRAEMEQKARLEAEKQARVELELKAREEADKKAREEMDRMASAETARKARDEAERRQKEELDRRVKEEVMKKMKEETERLAREEALRRAREEAEAKLREETERKSREAAEAKHREEKERSQAKPVAPVNEIRTSRNELPSKGDTALEGDRDEFVTIAVADIYTRQGLYEEASKIYRRITQMEPDNLEARKKLTDLEALMKSKGEKEVPAEKTQAPPPPAPETHAKDSPHPPPPEKDSGGKKRPNRVGYV